jgi:transcriptional regulator with XRE-family HTH domain
MQPTLVELPDLQEMCLSLAETVTKARAHHTAFRMLAMEIGRQLYVYSMREDVLRIWNELNTKKSPRRIAIEALAKCCNAPIQTLRKYCYMWRNAANELGLPMNHQGPIEDVYSRARGTVKKGCPSRIEWCEALANEEVDAVMRNFEARTVDKGALANALRNRMQEKGMTIEALSQRVGLETNAVKAYVSDGSSTGREPRGFENLKKIAEVLGLDVLDLDDIRPEPAPRGGGAWSKEERAKKDQRQKLADDLERMHVDICKAVNRFGSLQRRRLLGEREVLDVIAKALNGSLQRNVAKARFYYEIDAE